MLDSSLITLQLQHHRPPPLCPAATDRDNEGHVEVRECMFWCTPQHMYVRISPPSIVTSHIVGNKACSQMQQASSSIVDVFFYGSTNI
jgi:hypothetical protein